MYYYSSSCLGSKAIAAARDNGTKKKEGRRLTVLPHTPQLLTSDRRSRHSEPHLVVGGGHAVTVSVGVIVKVVVEVVVAVLVGVTVTVAEGVVMTAHQQ